MAPILLPAPPPGYIPDIYIPGVPFGWESIAWCRPNESAYVMAAWNHSTGQMVSVGGDRFAATAENLRARIYCIGR